MFLLSQNFSVTVQILSRYSIYEDTLKYSESEVAQLCPTLCTPMDYSPPGSSVHGDSPGKNTGVGSHALLQGIFPTQGSNPGLPYCRWILYCLRHQASPFKSIINTNKFRVGKYLKDDYLTINLNHYKPPNQAAIQFRNEYSLMIGNSLPSLAVHFFHLWSALTTSQKNSYIEKLFPCISFI